MRSAKTETGPEPNQRVGAQRRKCHSDVMRRAGVELARESEDPNGRHPVTATTTQSSGRGVESGATIRHEAFEMRELLARIRCRFAGAGGGRGASVAVGRWSSPRRGVARRKDEPLIAHRTSSGSSRRSPPAGGCSRASSSLEVGGYDISATRG